MSDIDTEAADSLKALDPKRPISEADIGMRWSRKAPLRMTHFDVEVMGFAALR